MATKLPRCTLEASSIQLGAVCACNETSIDSVLSIFVAYAVVLVRLPKISIVQRLL
ncbi:hypothetical protein BDV09DRAFT_173116 [Aspergillus tetrazonus]